MIRARIQGDPAKNRSKRKKHRVSFERRRSPASEPYDLSKLDWKRNPYAKRLKKAVTIRLDEDLIAYFKELGKEIGIPYQRLINLYLRDCAESRRKAVLRWVGAS